MHKRIGQSFAKKTRANNCHLGICNTTRLGTLSLIPSSLGPLPLAPLSTHS
jgi:hypothetical protein